MRMAGGLKGYADGNRILPWYTPPAPQRREGTEGVVSRAVGCETQAGRVEVGKRRVGESFRAKRRGEEGRTGVFAGGAQQHVVCAAGGARLSRRQGRCSALRGARCGAGTLRGAEAGARTPLEQVVRQRLGHDVGHRLLRPEAHVSAAPGRCSCGAAGDSNSAWLLRELGRTPRRAFKMRRNSFCSRSVAALAVIAAATTRAALVCQRATLLIRCAAGHVQAQKRPRKGSAAQRLHDAAWRRLTSGRRGQRGRLRRVPPR